MAGTIIQYQLSAMATTDLMSWELSNQTRDQYQIVIWNLEGGSLRNGTNHQSPLMFQPGTGITIRS